MSGWRPILERELNEIKKIKYSKINCILQDIADKFQREGLSKLEVSLINMAIVNKEMLNEKNAESFYRSRWDLLLKSEGMDEIEELKSLIKEATPWIDDYNCNHISDFIGDEKAELFQRSVSKWLEKAERIK